MKKLLLSLTLLLSLVWATPASALGLNWGLTGGLNLSKLSLNSTYKQAFSSDNRAGWYLGAKANVSIAMGFGVDASLVYSQQKYNLQADPGVDYSSDSKTMRYISIPINLRYNIGLGSIASVFVATGPQFDFNVGSRNWNILSSDYTGTNGLFKSENMTTSWNVGAGVKVLGRVELSVGYNFGLSKVANTLATNLSGHEFKNDDLKANTFKVGVAVYF